MKNNPRVTFALFSYNQEEYIREAVEGAFAQTYEPLEIILSDDSSGDRTFEIMQEMALAYEGPHQVRIRRNEQNSGLAEHVNILLKSAKGKYFVAAAGDDISLPDRTAKAVDALEHCPGATFCESAYISIDAAGHKLPTKKPLYESGKSLNLDDLVSGRLKGLTGASRVYDLEALNQFPGLNNKCPTEDSPFVLRCLLTGNGLYIPDALIKWRRHDNNLSGQDSLQRMDLWHIWSQYESDLEHIYQSKKISRGVFERTKLWIVRMSYQRSLNQRLGNEKLNLRKEIAEIKNSGDGVRAAMVRLKILSKVFVKRAIKQ